MDLTCYLHQMCINRMDLNMTLVTWIIVMTMPACTAEYLTDEEFENL